MANNSVVTQDKLQEFYDTKVYPYLNGATHTGCVPLGTILPYFGETAPTHFLICDGTEYAKADYPELAEHLLALTDPSPYVVSGDNTKFKVPDLRGEFLRGTGTNSHSGQHDGADVGIHQDATEIPVYAIQNGTLTIFGNNNYNYPRKHDGIKENATVSGAINTSTLSSSVEAVVRVRPTNTSVTYIIAYRNAYIDLALDSFPIDISNPTDGQLLMYDATAGRWVNGGHKYSTDEHVVGTWIDGKPVYEKSYYVYFPTTGQWTDYELVDLSNLNIERLILFDGTVSDRFPYHYKINDNVYWDIWIPNKNANILSTGKWAVSVAQGISIVLRYTKTTDTV